MVALTRMEYNLIAKSRGIIEPQKMSTQELIDTLSRYDSRRKVKSNRRKLLKIKLEKIAKIQNISKNELNKAEKLQNKSVDGLRGIARLRRIKKRNNLTREDLIISLLKSESNPVERNHMKHFNNSTNDDDDDDDDDNDDTYGDKIKYKIYDIRMILTRLGNILMKNDRKKIKKELYEIEKKENLSDNEKEKIYDHLAKLVNTLGKKEENKHTNRDDLDYFGITDTENLIDDVDVDDYYKPIFVKSSLKKNYKFCESRGDKDKKLSVKQYFYMIIPHLRDLINDHRAIENNSKE